MTEKSSPESIEDSSEQICKNCETHFEGNFCPNCGQSTYEFNKPISFLIVDLLGNVFAFDTRFWKTFAALIFKPGFYSAEYLQGHRARYAPPFRVYLFISLGFFLLLSSYANRHVTITDNFKSKFNNSINKEVNPDSIFTDSLIQDNFKIKLSGDEDQKEELGESLKQIIQNPQLYLSSFIRFFSWSLFLLMPVYAIFLWLLFHKTRPFYYGHLVFSLNQHALVFLIFSLLLAIKLIFPSKQHSYENWLAVYIPFYFYFGALKLYGNKKWPTLFKMLLASFLYTLILSISMGLIIIAWYWMEFL